VSFSHGSLTHSITNTLGSQTHRITPGPPLSSGCCIPWVAVYLGSPFTPGRLLPGTSVCLGCAFPLGLGCFRPSVVFGPLFYLGLRFPWATVVCGLLGCDCNCFRHVPLPHSGFRGTLPLVASGPMLQSGFC
jgi:hypothetical protein